jgi:hypothetical protein
VERRSVNGVLTPWDHGEVASRWPAVFGWLLLVAAIFMAGQAMAAGGLSLA